VTYNSVKTNRQQEHKVNFLLLATN